MTAPRVLIAGTGFAGKGHTVAFRAAGAEVVGMVGRTDHVVRDVAAELAIPYASTDWAAALAELKPDIVSIATPGGAHDAQITQAIAAGCHVFCDKPMTTQGDTATKLYDLAQQKGVKTAYAASFQYTPSVQHAKRLIAEGVNNNFTHSLAITQTLVAGDILQIAGDVRDDLGRAPKVDGVHDFTKRRGFIPDDLDDPALEWGESNVEWSYTVMARLGSALAAQPVSVLFKHGGLVPRFHDDHIVIYGTKGAIYLKGHYGSGPLSLHDGTGWAEQPTPADIAASVPAGLGETEQCWHVLAGHFVRDIQGENVPPYPTFAQGSLYQNIIDVIRKSDTWADVDGGTL